MCIIFECILILVGSEPRLKKDSNKEVTALLHWKCEALHLGENARKINARGT